jgi:hypothetical protein
VTQRESRVQLFTQTFVGGTDREQSIQYRGILRKIRVAAVLEATCFSLAQKSGRLARPALQFAVEISCGTLQQPCHDDLAVEGRVMSTARPLAGPWINTIRVVLSDQAMILGTTIGAVNLASTTLPPGLTTTSTFASFERKPVHRSCRVCVALHHRPKVGARQHTTGPFCQMQSITE